MKILFIVQGEGRGHLTQAISMEEMLRRNGHEVVEVLVGKSDSRRLPGFFNRNIQAPIKRFYSPNFAPTAANKRANILRSILYNLQKLPVYLKSMSYIHSRIKETEADLVINFYELLAGFTYLLYRPSTPQICIGHQYLFLHPDFRFPRGNKIELRLLRLFTRLTCIGARQKLALSFCKMEDDASRHIRIVPPLIRREVLTCEATDGEYIHGYMVNAGFADSVMKWHERHREMALHFFWDKPGEADEIHHDSTLCFHQIDDVKFLRYMCGCKAYASTAGFESVCEAMYLGKPLLMVPAHVEQDCNAFDACRNGAGIVAQDFDMDRLLKFIEGYKPNLEFRSWVCSCEWYILRCIESVNISANEHSSFHPLYPLLQYLKTGHI